MGSAPEYAAAARALGQAIGERGWRLVYGGGRAGLMGVVADATLAAGGHVTGIIPRRLMDLEVGHAQLHELRVVETMHERKQQMAELADVFVALPGGLGTLEELFEVWTWHHLGYHQHPIGLLDTLGFYQPLLGLVDHMRQAGFVVHSQSAMLHVEADPTELLNKLARSSLQSSAETRLDEV